MTALVSGSGLIACGPPSNEPPRAEPSATAHPGSVVAPSPGVTPRAAEDENGVRIAGGETSAIGSSSSAPPRCRYAQPIDLNATEARAAGLANVDAGIAVLDRQYDAAFRYADGSQATLETRITLSADLVSVRRTPSERIDADDQSAVCGDRLEYRAIIELATADGGISGRFYARLVASGVEPPTLSAANITPDLRNFQGSLELALDLDRPLWAAMNTTLVLSERSFQGSLEVLINYTDDDLPAYSSGAGRSGSGGFWPPATATDSPPFTGPSPNFVRPPEGATPTPLRDYRGSVILPTCAVILNVGSIGDNPDTFQAVDADVLVDEVRLGFPDGSNGVMAGPTPGGPPIPWDIGPVHAGALIDITVRGATPDGRPFAGIYVPPFGVDDRCKVPGCVAHVEHQLNAYCDW